MTMRQRRKQFWWTWHHAYHSHWWGVGRIIRQHPDCIKDRDLG